MSGPRSNRPTPPAVVFDMLGQELNIGDLVLMTRRLNKWTAIIVDITPRLDPRSKEHLMTVQLTASFPVVALRNGRADEMWRMQTQEQTGWKPERDRDKDDTSKDEVIGDSAIILP